MDGRDEAAGVEQGLQGGREGGEGEVARGAADDVAGRVHGAWVIAVWKMVSRAARASRCGLVGRRRERAAREFFGSVAESLLQDIWMSWTPYMQMAFTLVGLEAMAAQLPNGRAFDIHALLRDLPHLAPELRKLEQWGFVYPAADRAVGYAPQAEVLVWYLADTLTRALRPEGVDVAAWLAAQEWQGLLKRGEMQALQRALSRVGGLLQEGASILIRAAAEGAARHLRGE